MREASGLDRCGKPTPYEMDGDGRVTSMNDEHNNTTTYGYDGEGKLTSLTARGNTPSPQPSLTPVGVISLRSTSDKRGSNWSYDDLKQLTHVSLPNGMTTNYLFDDTGHQTALHHQ